jgi:hypothetical protein
MSRVYFHTQHEGPAELLGAERAHAGITVSNLFMAHLRADWDTPSAPSPIRRLLPPDSYITRIPLGTSTWERTLRIWCSTAMMQGDEFHFPDGRRGDPWHVALNTAIVAGSDPVRLLARLHAQCEVHGYIDGPDRAWAADLIQAGRRDKILHRDTGWENVVTLLQAGDTGRVFMSYSVTDPFPNPTAADYPYGDAWYALDPDQQWRLAEAQVTQDATLRIAPETLGAQGFGLGLSAFDLNEMFTDWALEEANR